VRRECLDRLLIFSRRQLEHVVRVYRDLLGGLLHEYEHAA
jgi:hypothetical protein